MPTMCQHYCPGCRKSNEPHNVHQTETDKIWEENRIAIYSVHVVKDCDHDAIRSDSRDHQEVVKTLLVPDNPQTL